MKKIFKKLMENYFISLAFIIFLGTVLMLGFWLLFKIESISFQFIIFSVVTVSILVAIIFNKIEDYLEVGK